MTEMAKKALAGAALAAALTAPAALAGRVGPEGVSPRIERLRKDVKAGNAGAVEAFWKEVREKGGTPILEPIPGDAEHLMMTMLWRGGDLKNVCAVFTDVNTRSPLDMALARLGGADVWYLTCVAPRNFRCSYLMVFNYDPSQKAGAYTIPEKDFLSPVKGRPNWVRDPLNPRSFREDPPNDPYSVVALPGAEPEPYLVDRRQPGVPAGKVEELSLHSDILQRDDPKLQDRKVWVYTPPGYRPDGAPCALLIHFDGRTYVEDFMRQVALDNLIAKGDIPPTIAVFVRQTNRDKELTCNAAFADFLAEELLPWLRERYRVTDDPKQTVAAGSSLGGMAAVYVAQRHPERFGNVIALSGAFLYGPYAEKGSALIDQLAAGPKLPLRFHLCAGQYEPAIAAGVLRLRDALTAKGYPVRFVGFAGGHSYYARQGIFAEAMSLLIGKRKAELR